MKRRFTVVWLCGICLIGLFTAVHHLQSERFSVDPKSDVIFISSRYITGILATPDGGVWAGSYGGVLYRDPHGAWRRYTRMDGLPSNEVRSVRQQAESVLAVTPLGTATLREGVWHTVSGTGTGTQPDADPQGRLCAATWNGGDYAATVSGLKVRDGKQWRDLAMPASLGTHISALLPHGNALWAALFGDGLWAYNAHGWQRVDVGLPAEAREITAMEQQDSTLWLGTRRAGLWEYRDGRWQQYLEPDEPVDHNCEAIAAYADALYFSTLEDGLVVRSKQGWAQLQPPVISSKAPRQMVTFAGQLYLRHGNGKVDRYDGVKWQRDVCHDLPRKEASALASDNTRLYVAQWGGWSEFDGKTWTHFLTRPELQGVPVTVLYPEKDRLWIGTQSRGMAEYDRVHDSLLWHDERNGMPDDWVTAIVRVGGDLYAGTFVGGLARLAGKQWRAVSELAGENVTALTSKGMGTIYIATRHGVWQIADHAKPELVVSNTIPVDPEAQALYSAPTGLWVGTRTGLFFLKR